MNLAQTILNLFAGRLDHVAVESPGMFEPERLSSPLTPERLEREHLAGVRGLGFYVLNEDSRCRVTCVDFDHKPENPNPQWRTQVETLFFALQSFGLSPIVEMSQSGNGAHVWLFLSEWTDAWIARAWWKAVESKLETKFKEIFPKQDRLTGKGLGNLVRYPLWNQSAFVDLENEWAMLDPLETLAGVQTTTGADLRSLAFHAGMGTLAAEPHPATTTIAGDFGVLSARVAELVSQPTTLAGKRWRADYVGLHDKSMSACAMSLCCELVRAYVPTDDVKSALRYWCRMHNDYEKGRRDKWIDDTVIKAYHLLTNRKETKSTSVTTFKDAAHLYIDQIEQGQQIIVPSGIAELDASVDGVAPGEVCVIAGRPGHGKSAVGIQWLDNAAGLNVKGLLISEEMGAIEIGKRRVMSASMIPQDQWVAASAAALRRDVDAHHRDRADVYIVESCNNIDRAEEVIDQFCTLYDVGLVAVDYLQLLGSRNAERYEVVTEVSRRIKQAARRNNVPILLLSQLNRQVENRDDNEPKMSDLRESGQIEQDADLIVFAQYPCKFDVDQPPDLYRLIAAKRRNGPIRSPRMEVTFNPSRQLLGGMSLPPDLLDL